MSYTAIVDFSVAGGLPCQIGVVEFKQVKGSFSRNAPSDVDYYGYTEVEYDILDRKGRRAGWIEKRMTNDDHDRARQAVITHCGGEEC